MTLSRQTSNQISGLDMPSRLNFKRYADCCAKRRKKGGKNKTQNNFKFASRRVFIVLLPKNKKRAAVGEYAILHE